MFKKIFIPCVVFIFYLYLIGKNNLNEDIPKSSYNLYSSSNNVSSGPLGEEEQESIYEKLHNDSKSDDNFDKNDNSYITSNDNMYYDRYIIEKRTYEELPVSFSVQSPQGGKWEIDKIVRNFDISPEIDQQYDGEAFGKEVILIHCKLSSTDDSFADINDISLYGDSVKGSLHWRLKLMGSYMSHAGYYEVDESGEGWAAFSIPKNSKKITAKVHKNVISIKDPNAEEPPYSLGTTATTDFRTVPTVTIPEFNEERVLAEF